MNWFVLFVAGLFEVVWAISLKYSHGFSKLIPSIITVASIIISMGLLAYSLKQFPVGTAYSVWTGIGAVGTVLLGILFFNEPKDLTRLFFIALIIIGIVGLKFSSH